MIEFVITYDTCEAFFQSKSFMLLMSHYVIRWLTVKHLSLSCDHTYPTAYKENEIFPEKQDCKKKTAEKRTIG